MVGPAPSLSRIMMNGLVPTAPAGDRAFQSLSIRFGSRNRRARLDSGRGRMPTATEKLKPGRGALTAARAARPPASLPGRGARPPACLPSCPSDQKALARVSESTRQARARCTATGWASLGRVPPQPARPGAAPRPPAARGPALPVVCGGPRPTVAMTRPTVTVTPTRSEGRSSAAAGLRAAASGDASAGRSAAHTGAGPAAGRPQRSGTPRGVLTHH